MQIIVTTGNTGGSGYGLAIRHADVRLFRREWGTVTIELPDGTVARANIDKDSFYDNCPYLIRKEIKDWLRVSGYLTWPSGKPPKFELELIDPNKGVFRLYDNQN